MRLHALLALLAGLAALTAAAGCSKPAPSPSPTGAGPRAAGPAAASPSDLSGASILMVIAPKDFRDEELLDVREALEGAGASVKVASTTIAECKGMYGAKVSPDLLLADADAADYDAVVFVGGTGAEALFDEAQAVVLAKSADQADKVVGAICIAPVILANAGVLEGRMATVWPGGRERKALEEGGAIYTGDEVTQDTNIVTGDGPRAADAFAELLIETIVARRRSGATE